MEKENLIKIAKELHKEAFDANAYYLIMQQYKQFKNKYSPEMQLSPAFYNVVYDALQKACFMEIAKLYDQSKDVISIGWFLTKCQENISFFPEYRDIIKINDDGVEYSFPVPYQHHLKTEEECFFKKQVESQRAIFKIFNIDSSESTPVQVDLTFPEFLDLYCKRFRSLSKKKENIRVQRNKIYAHNDTMRIMNEETIYQQNPITYPDIQELIDFALDCIGLILGILTGICPATEYSNIDDWEGTLMLAKLGLKYQNYDSEQKEKLYGKNFIQGIRSE